MDLSIPTAGRAAPVREKLPENQVTPATNDDELISGVEVVGSGHMTQQQWDFCEKKTFKPEDEGPSEAVRSCLQSCVLVGDACKKGNHPPHPY
ncbi:hypothetical protein PR001_g9555 [Phytophthora rubi]|uniref:Uncharacterized protein n=1 Tax=Phytophthora rubi TaxID=129364 RepID=A0A6A3MP84_9STRA|nr:hypothetical protein PR001_g9555 [Phytophthora rubi]